MDERVRFIAALRTGALTMAEACRLFGISRKSGYKWLERYETQGVRGLEEQSRAPHTVPWATGDKVSRLLVETRRAHPTWGAGKILDVLANQGCTLELPAPSTAHEVLKRHGLVEGRKRRRQLIPPKTPLAHMREPNDGWCADFKGHFRLGNRCRCDPLTITDGCSRFLLCCKAVDKPTTEFVQPAFEAIFREFGLPLSLRTDNGPPFASRGLGGLSRLSVSWVKLGITLERIEPGKPQQNGRHERMHKTLNEAIYPPAHDVEAQQRRFDAFREEFNHVRPHDALQGKPPSSIYRPSSRPYPSKITSFEYPAHFEIRMVRTDGTFQWKGHLVYCTQALIGEPIALEEVEDGRWLLRFGPLTLAILDERQKRPLLARLP